MMDSLFEKHQSLLNDACRAITARTYWSAYPESPSPKVYGEQARADADAQFALLTGRPFELPGHPVSAWMGLEVSPLAEPIGISYPSAPIEDLVRASHAARAKWAQASAQDRAGVCLEILHRLNRQSHLIALACRITTGQAFVMAFQSGGPHAQERGLEAVAYAYQEMARIPQQILWQKPQGKGAVLSVEKRFTIIPRGISVAIGCATFPTWNTYAGAFASLATGNSLIVKPHPSSILPLALTVRIAREVLSGQGFDPNVVLLAPDETESPITKQLVMHPDVAIVDFTGGPAFGEWLRAHARHALLYTEEAGINSIIIDSTDDFRGMCQNIAFSLSLYSGQMCTAPQNLLIARDGIDTNEGHKNYAEVAAGIGAAVRSLLADPARAEGILGAIQSEDTLARVKQVAAEGQVVLQSGSVEFPGAPRARTATPLIRAVDANQQAVFGKESFGPISYAIATESTQQSIQLAQGAARSKGAITMGLYSTDPEVIRQAEQAAIEAGVSLSCNLLGNVFINQNAAFSDFHVSGANPAGNASLTDTAFVANRFRVVASRKLATPVQPDG